MAGSLLGVMLVSHRPASANTLQLSESVQTMELTSRAFSANQQIPSKYTCDGDDISPPLSWSEPPAGTQSFALICDDPDAPVGTFVHWVWFNIPADTRQLPESIANEANPSVGGIQGKNNFGKLGYGGPCPPGGNHRYFFKLYALDTQLSLEAGANKSQVVEAMEGHILANAELVGRYQRKS
ncbi:YbhB/YbcL family Raf kinase inhibitor-like protein [Geitlerinema sp. PCC 9228]|uniref:YbhB/YbcL family Raf kinase inhibitor-like protein n=1 Tax=Geitlerinema sp. PCC 9228 TaxID=111611 RepID=UPI001FCDEF21|nr:YbhB/YbcL family Raf kinase inhibitor-like protein [Geitlerinema sp. PCC 9228]